MKRRLIPVLAPKALGSLPTKQLLGRLRSLQQCEESEARSDRTPEEVAVSKGIVFKNTAEWQQAYADLKAVLATREHIPTAAERATTRQQRTVKSSNKRGKGGGGVVLPRRAGWHWPATPHPGSSVKSSR